ncbi:lytic transglycosylase domain-containing protein [Rouxiella sp. Mn2063]|uniref:lytic transglycosylase domain-containing protein n=1 Tax=Rouxiella sp. Mn2063 TaxID=3395262 RepID=UPI003BE264F1
MIIQELAYKVTIKADEFLNGKRKIGTEFKKLEGDFDRSSKNITQTLKSSTGEMTQFGKSAVSSFRGVTAAAAGFLGIGAGLYGIKQLFTSTANEIVRASTQAKFFGSDVNKVFGVQRGFKQAGLNGDAFISAAGSARMALANIQDPTIFGGLTGAAQNLMVLGARTGLNINQLGDPNKALSEFTRYSKTHSQDNLMQVMSAAGFDPTDAAKIKSGELKSLVDSETKKSNITAEQVKEQENLVATLGQLDSEFSRLRQDLAVAFAPEVIDAMKAFGAWMKDHQGDIVGFFRNAGDKVKAFTDAVGGAENALKILAAGYIGSKVVGGTGGLIRGAVGGAAALGGAALAPAAVATAGALAAILLPGNIGQDVHDTVTDAPWMKNIRQWVAAGGAANDYKPEWSDDPAAFADALNKQQSNAVNNDALLDAIRHVESSGNPNAVGPQTKYGQAVGHYQFMPDTAKDLGLRVSGGVDERRDPEKSREAAANYMGQLLKRYNGNLEDSLRAYNWGMGNVDQWIEQGRGGGFSNKKGDWVPMPSETREYPGKVFANIKVEPEISQQPKSISKAENKQHYEPAPSENSNSAVLGGEPQNQYYQLTKPEVTKSDLGYSKEPQLNSLMNAVIAGKKMDVNSSQKTYISNSNEGNSVDTQTPGINSALDKVRSAMQKNTPVNTSTASASNDKPDALSNEYYLQQQKLADSRYASAPSSVNNSKTSSTHIGTVVVNSNPQSIDALTNSIQQQSQRAATNASFSSAVGG